jgi:hypothetical protein
MSYADPARTFGNSFFEKLWFLHPLLVALCHQRLYIANLFLDNGASTDGVLCQVLQRRGRQYNLTHSIAIRKPLFNSLLDRLLMLATKHERHWSQVPGFMRLLHIAAAFNPGGIKILFAHVYRNDAFFRCVTTLNAHVKPRRCFVICPSPYVSL